MRLRPHLPALAAGSLLITLGFVEIGFRIAGPSPFHRPRIVVGQDGRTAEWCCVGELTLVDNLYHFPPNTRFKHCYDGNPNGEFDPENCVPYQINSSGFRDFEFQTEKPAGTYRIIILGDSFTVGEGVPVERIFPHRLAAALAGKTIDGKRIEVLNLGVSGEDTDGEITHFHREARALEPDMVVLQWNTNDFPSSKVAHDHLRLIGLKYREAFEPPTLLRWSHAAGFAWHWMRLRSLSNETIALSEEEIGRGAVNFTKILLFSNLVRSSGREFAVLLFPELIRFNDYPYASLLEKLRTFLAAEKIPVIDLVPELSKHRDRDLWAHETDHHPNGLAHDIAAQALLRYLTPRLEP